MSKATAPANFALSKYWGKSDAHQRHPAVPSISACVEELLAHAAVTFSEPDAQHTRRRPVDEIRVDGHHADAGTRQRIDAVRL